MCDTPNTKPHPRWCVFVFGIIPAPPMHAEHENRSMLVYFCVWYALPHTLNTKAHPCWCVFMFSVIPAPPMHAKHENRSMLVYFCVQCLCYALPHTPNTKPHPCWCVSVLSAFPTPPMYLIYIFYILLNNYIHIILSRTVLPRDSGTHHPPSGMH